MFTDLSYICPNILSGYYFFNSCVVLIFVRSILIFFVLASSPLQHLKFSILGPKTPKVDHNQEWNSFRCYYYSYVSHGNHHNHVALYFKINSGVVIRQDKIIMVVVCQNKLGELICAHLSLLHTFGSLMGESLASCLVVAIEQ